MNWFFSFLLAILVSSYVSASDSVPSTLVNEVLFSFTGKSYTKYDLDLYKSVLKGEFEKDKLTDFLTSEEQDFLFFELSVKEAEVFKVESDQLKKLETAKRKYSNYSKDEVYKMSVDIANVMAYLDIRSKQMSDKIRFDSWYDLLRRKYQIKYKADVFGKK